MCPLQIINDIEPLSSTLYGANAHFIHHPSNLENYSIGHKEKPVNQKKTQENIFTPFLKFLAPNSKYPLLQKFGQSFDIQAICT